MIRPLQECPCCRGAGYQIVKNPFLTASQPDRWIRITCRRCKGAGFIRE